MLGSSEACVAAGAGFLGMVPSDIQVLVGVAPATVHTVTQTSIVFETPPLGTGTGAVSVRAAEPEGHQPENVREPQSAGQLGAGQSSADLLVILAAAAQRWRMVTMLLPAPLGRSLPPVA